jgi:arylsulfotransferase ASST
VRRALALGGLLALLTFGSAYVHAAPGSPQPGPAGLDVQPFPGTPDASPKTDVSFPNLEPGQLRSVTVSGSRSGQHRGTLHALPDGRGTAFTPARPFVNGERVSVHALLRSPAGGTAIGAPRATQISFSFGVAAPLPMRGARATFVRHDILDSNGFTHSYHSINWIHPPLAWMFGKDPDPGAGDIFADAENSIQAGPMILNPQGQLIYFMPLRQSAAFNVEVQNYLGQSVLTYWQGYVKHSVGIGTDMILNHNYTPIAKVNGGNGYHADLHDFTILPNGDALITAYAEVPNVDLRSVGGPRKGTLLDSIIQEINIATGHVDWEWHAYGHVTLSESYVPKTENPYDFFHINSVQLLPNGNLLVSARGTWTIYEINMQTGKIPYNFGGKNSSFKLGAGARFAWQHDATMQPNGTITVFDDGAGNYKAESQSRALRLWVHYKSHQITLAHAYTHRPPLLTNAQGSVQALGDGNTFVGWGSAPYFTEFSKGGGQLFGIHFDKPLQSYRGFRFPWSARPNTPPSVAASAKGSHTTVYASWNGATDVAAWELLAGSSTNPALMHRVGRFTKTYFETTMTVASTQRYFAVQALNSAGQVMGTSAAVPR